MFSASSSCRGSAPIRDDLFISIYIGRGVNNISAGPHWSRHCLWFLFRPLHGQGWQQVGCLHPPPCGYRTNSHLCCMKIYKIGYIKEGWPSHPFQTFPGQWVLHSQHLESFQQLLMPLMPPHWPAHYFKHCLMPICFVCQSNQNNHPC